MPFPKRGPDEAEAGIEAAAGTDAGAEAEAGPKARSRLREVGLTIATVVGVVALIILVQTFLIKPFSIPTGSMEPTIRPGDLVLVNRLATHPHDGDIVVFYSPADADSELCGRPNQGNGTSALCSLAAPQRSATYFIKRVVGVPGDRLSLRAGRLYRNGKPVYEPYTSPCGDYACNFPQTITVPPGHYFMMGDNRSNSDDSRFWGAIPRSWIIGQAFVILWPPGRLHTL